MHRPIINSFQERRHEFQQASGRWAQCAGPGYCRECNLEAQRPYDSAQTKAKIRAVLEEHVGPGVAESIGDRQPLFTDMDRDSHYEFGEALATEFGVKLPPKTLIAGTTLDDLARFIDVMLDTKHKGGH